MTSRANLEATVAWYTVAIGLC